MSEEKSSYGPSIGFTGLLTIVFITLKLCNIITWGWLWVLAPIWMPAAAVITIIIAILMFAGFGGFIALIGIKANNTWKRIRKFFRWNKNEK